MKRTLFLALAFSISSSAFAQWSTFHGDNQRTGRTTVQAPVTPSIRWSLPLGEAIISSPVIAPDGTIVLGSVLDGKMQPKHFVVAVNPDGTVKWRFRTGPSFTQVPSTPAIGPNGNVYVGAQDRFFYALDSQGQLLWKHRAQSRVHQHPVVAGDGTVYIGLDSDLHAFSPSGALLWTVDLGDNDLPGGPTLGHDGTIYIGGGTRDVHSTLYAINPNGTTKWTYPMWWSAFLPITPPVVADDGTVYIATDRLYALDPSGTLKWTQQPHFTPLATLATPTLDAAGNLYLVESYTLYKFTPQGALAWEKKLDDPDSSYLGHSFSSGLVDGTGRLYLGFGTNHRAAIPYEKRLQVVSTSTGAFTNHIDLPEIPGLSAPAIAPDGTLYVGCTDGKLYAFEE